MFGIVVPAGLGAKPMDEAFYRSERHALNGQRNEEPVPGTARLVSTTRDVLTPR
jgi:hypothetical protein